MSTLSDLNKRFAIKGQLEFREEQEGNVIARVSNRLATAEIMLQGAQMISWAPVNHKPVIWISGQAQFAPGKSLRGGIPICWPWFGTNDLNPELPAHGFARNRIWDISETKALDDGRTLLVFTLNDLDTSSAIWPYRTTLEYRVCVGEILKLELVTKNTDTATIRISEALHTYFNIGDISKVSIHGLEDTDYLDKVDYGQRKIQQGPVIVDSEVDRVYLGTRAECVIKDAEIGREIHIQKNGSESTVVWNPWISKSRKLGDLGEEGYRSMLCVESGNAAEDSVDIAPGETHQMSVTYMVKELS